MKHRDVPIFLLLSAVMATADVSTIISHENCDSNSLPAESTSVSTLDNGQFYKMCPGSHQHSNNTTFATFGQPRCGDGSNFAFYLTRPEQPQEEEKILIDLSGGGACWDKGTCALQGFMLKMPPIDFVLGMSCSDVGKIAEVSTGWDILCARTVGETDFTEYNTVVIPYCTQDVHLGDAEAIYDGMNVQHVGAHNTYRTLQWVFDNFEDPSHIVLTGCSAGATPLPVIYHMVNEHYKERGQNVKVDIIADSPVYLTPTNFMENNFGNWNHETVMKSIGFDYDTHKGDLQYASAVLDYVLDESDDSDGIGIFSHNDDPISLMYYNAMGGKGDAEVSAKTKWWSDMNASWSQLKNDHENFDVFIADSSGHCSSGLYIPNQQPDFEKWVSNIIAPTTSVQQDAPTNTSVTNIAVTDPTSVTAEDESGSLDSPVSSMNNNGDLSSVDSQADPPSAATTKTAAGQNHIATMLFFHLSFSLLG
eukprot:CAMPEP_0201690300 /NCGR_PEP_ID=MMETSP0578-20130828/3767_1 /ASSEMBLY_ACC=CAM_ASM_000663 /TAXON_ID=267565 /ORGANISM="Skeletonema grethea, Strain CCMP 1804" /LENGTH=476 /DNA_ID=CAMNT_0048175245 /DNA_START=113 /DNA_END=1543 /DNA_ORIENTATION=+